MGSRNPGNEYPRTKPGKRPGVLNHHQTQLYSEHGTLIRNTLASNPELNVSQISEKTQLDRRTIRKHLVNLQRQGAVMNYGAGYFLVDGSSDELHSSVGKAFKEISITRINIPFVRNAAACYTIVDPDKSRYAFEDLFESKLNQFLESGFWLDEILAYAMRRGFLSSRAYSKEKKKPIDTRLLREVWQRCFGDTRLLVFACAVSPPELLRFLTSVRGNSWSTRFLRHKWDSIMREVDRKPSDLGRQLIKDAGT